jgi:Glycosyltransferase family 87
MGKATHVAGKAEAFMSRTVAVRESIRRQWRPVILPALALWTLTTVVSCGFLHPFDVTEYERYAHAALRAPFLHRFPLEYPAPALVVFMLPLLLPISYPWALAVVAGVVLLLLVTSYEGSGIEGMDIEAAGRFIVYLAVGATFFITGRYDIFAVAAAFWSVRAARQGRWSAAWTWSCIGFVLKLFPVIFWPAFLIAEWRRNGRPPVRRLAWMVGSLVVVAGIPALLNRSAALNVVRYYLRRPTEIGSVPAGLSFLIDWHGTRLVKSFQSVNVVNGISRPMSVVFGALAVVGCLVIWRAQLRDRLPLEAVCLATLTLSVLGAKVLSAQYLMWLMPLWALYRIRPVWLLAALANVVVFPYEVSAQTASLLPSHLFESTVTLIFLGRDLLIAWGTWTWLRSVWVDRSSSAVVTSGPGPPRH